MTTTQIVPCGNCTECCKRDLIFLKPDLGDKVGNYDCVFVIDKWILKHKKNGDCIYLDRAKGCTIYSNRPVVCRGLDCRFILDLPRDTRKEYIARGLIRKSLLKAARELRKRCEKSTY